MSTSQTTPNLGLTQPAIGSQDWGLPLNQDLMIIDTAIGNLQNGFAGPWQSGVIYTKAQIVTLSGGGAYISLQNNNIGHTPVSSPTFWAALVSAAQVQRGAFDPTKSYAVNDIATYQNSSYLCNTATAPVVTGGGPLVYNMAGNLFDQTTVNTGYVLQATGLSPLANYDCSGFVYVHGVSQIVSNKIFQSFTSATAGAPPDIWAFYDGSYAQISSSVDGGGNVTVNPGTPLAVPAAAYYFRFWWPESDNASHPISSTVVNAGTTVLSPYQAYQPPSTGGTTTPSALPTDTTHWTNLGAMPVGLTSAQITAIANTQPLAGAQVAVIGDSISTYTPAGMGTLHWQDVAIANLGATLAYDCHWAGRPMSNALDNSGENSVPAPTQAIVQGWNYLWLFLGTNMGSATGVPSATEIGTPADAPSNVANNNSAQATWASFCANFRYVIEQFLAWNPQLRIIWITPYQSARYSGFGNGALPTAASIAVMQGIATQGKAVCNLYGIPYVDLMNESGMCNLTNPTFTVDQLHPTATYINTRLAPMVAHKTQLVAQR